MRLFLRTTKYYPVLKNKYYSSTTLYHKVLPRTTLHYKVYSVLQSATPVLLCTTQHYSVVQTTTPVLLCTTKYYSSTTLYYKVLLQYYKVLLQYCSMLQSTTPVLFCTTKKLSTKKLIIQSCACTAQKTQAHDPICLRNLFHIVRTTSRHVPLRTWSQSATTYDMARCATERCDLGVAVRNDTRLFS